MLFKIIIFLRHSEFKLLIGPNTWLRWAYAFTNLRAFSISCLLGFYQWNSSWLALWLDLLFNVTGKSPLIFTSLVVALQKSLKPLIASVFNFWCFTATDKLIKGIILSCSDQKSIGRQRHLQGTLFNLKLLYLQFTHTIQIPNHVNLRLSFPECNHARLTSLYQVTAT